MLLATDLDGTLPLAGATLSEEVLRDLEKAGDRGIIRALITGRNFYSLSKVLTQELPFEYLCVSSGAGILKLPENKWIYSVSLEQNTSRVLYDFLVQKGRAFFCLDPVPESHHGFPSFDQNAPEDFFIRRELYRDFESPSFSPDLSQMIVVLSDEKERDTLIDDISVLDLPVHLIRTTSPFDQTTPWLEIFPRAVHKGSALEFLMTRHGILRQDTVALGNDWNDLDMLKAAGSAWVVPLSPDALKAQFPIAKGSSPIGVALEYFSRTRS